MRTRRGRIACWSLSAILVGVLVLAGARWGDFLCQYHLARLRRDPAYVDALLGSDEGTPARRALTLHAGTPDGFLALSRLWADAVLEAMVPASGRNRSLTLLSDLPPGLALLGIHGGSGNRQIYFKSASGLGRGGSIEGQPTASRLPALDAVLRASGILLTPEWVHPRFPNRRVRVLRGDLAFIATGLADQTMRLPRRDEIAALLFDGAAVGAGHVPSTCILPLLFRAWRREGAEVRRFLSEPLRSLGVDPEDPAPGLVALLGDPGALECRHPGACHPWCCRWTSAYSQHRMHPVARALAEMGPSMLPALSAGIDAGWTEACMVGALAAFEGLGKASLPYMEEARSRSTGAAQQRLEEARVGILYGSAPKYWVEADADGERTSLEAPQPPLESPDGP